MILWRICLLGDLRAERDGALVTRFPTRRSEMLIAASPATPSFFAIGSHSDSVFGPVPQWYLSVPPFLVRVRVP